MCFVLLGFCAFFTFCVVMAVRYRNPYKLVMVFGKKGSGKTTFLTKVALQNLKKGKTVYSTVYVPGVILFDVQEIGTHTFPEESVILIDEVGMIWDNRNFKNFRTDVRDYFKLQRQYRNTVYLFSQAFDIDVKLRDLTDAMYLCKCHMGWLSVARRIRKDITIVHPQGEGEARIADDIELEPVFLSLLGFKTAIFTYVPRWAKYFKSYNPPPLPFVEGELCGMPSPAPADPQEEAPGAPDGSGNTVQNRAENSVAGKRRRRFPYLTIATLKRQKPVE